MHNLGGAYVGSKQISRGLDYILKSFQIKKKVLPENHSLFIGITTSLAMTYFENNRIDSAIYYSKMAETIFKYNFNSDDVRLAKIYVDRAKFFNKIGDFNSALNLTMKVLKMDELTLNNEIMAYAYLVRGESFFAAENYKMALKSFHLGIVSNNLEFNDLDLNKVPTSYNVVRRDIYLNLLERKAQVLYESLKMIRFSKSDNILTLGKFLSHINDFTDYYKSKISSNADLQFFTSKVRQIYELIVKVEFELYQIDNDVQHIDKAYLAAEKSKSSIMFRKLSEVVARGDMLPDSLLSKLNILQWQISNLKHRAIADSVRSEMN